MITPMKLISGNNDVEVEDVAGSVFIDIQPWRDQGASVYLDFSAASALRDWLNGWIAANAPGAPDA